jgi:hypothetical protein
MKQSKKRVDIKPVNAGTSEIGRRAVARQSDRSLGPTERIRIGWKSRINLDSDFGADWILYVGCLYDLSAPVLDPGPQNCAAIAAGDCDSAGAGRHRAGDLA